MDRKIALLALALVGGGLTGCANPPVRDDSILSDPIPDYHRIISQNIELVRRSKTMNQGKACGDASNADSTECSIFIDPQRFELVGISSVRRVLHNTLGWTWLSCLRTRRDSQPPIYYAIFIANNRIVDSRMSVAIDKCELQPYGPL